MSGLGVGVFFLFRLSSSVVLMIRVVLLSVRGESCLLKSSVVSRVVIIGFRLVIMLVWVVGRCCSLVL